jgi:hypothetical protein
MKKIKIENIKEGDFLCYKAKEFDSNRYNLIYTGRVFYSVDTIRNRKSLGFKFLIRLRKDDNSKPDIWKMRFVPTDEFRDTHTVYKIPEKEMIKKWGKILILGNLQDEKD